LRAPCISSRQMSGTCGRLFDQTFRQHRPDPTLGIFFFEYGLDFLNGKHAASHSVGRTEGGPQVMSPSVRGGG
jgi:hypothetical protein